MASALKILEKRYSYKIFLDNLLHFFDNLEVEFYKL